MLNKGYKFVSDYLQFLETELLIVSFLFIFLLNAILKGDQNLAKYIALV